MVLEETVVFFDSTCLFCNRSINFIMDNDKRAVFKFASLQGPLAQHQLMQELKKKDEQIPDSLVLWQNGKIYFKSDAVLLIASQLSGIWPFFYYFGRIFPRFLRDFVYEMISKYRHKLINSTGAFRVLTPSEKERFID